MKQNFTRGNNMHWSVGSSSTMGASSAIRTRHQLRNSMRGTWAGQSRYSAHQENDVMQRAKLLRQLNKVLYTLEAPGEELGDYAPHVYAEEGNTKSTLELDAISIPDISFDPDLDLDLDFRFNNLASICMPSENTAYSTKPSSPRLETETRIQSVHRY